MFGHAKIMMEMSKVICLPKVNCLFFFFWVLEDSIISFLIFNFFKNCDMNCLACMKERAYCYLIDIFPFVFPFGQSKLNKIK